jgi:hypothetical protein
VDDEPLNCTLEPRFLDSGADYEAISYHWGSSTAFGTIVCDGKELQVPANLCSALKHLRYKDRSRVLWADAACINQSCHLDKQKQIPWMGDIFHNARCVLVWLGPESEDSQLAVALVSRLHKLIDTPPAFVSLWEEASSAKRREWRALRRLLERPWFYRLWVVQEVALATKIVVHCGPLVLDWDALVGVCVRAAYSTDGMKLSPRSLHTLFSLAHIRQRIADNVKLMMVQALVLTRSTQARFSKDKIYGILGLLEGSEARLLDVQATYQQAPEQIYQEVAFSIIQHTQSLDVLSVPRHTQPSALSEALPSWVPDWSAVSDGNTRRILEIGTGLLAFQATGNAAFEPVSRLGDSLVLQGHILDDEVAVVGPARRSTPAHFNINRKATVEGFKHAYDCFIVWAGMFLSPGNTTYVTGEDSADAFYYTLLGGYGEEADVARLGVCFRVWRWLHRTKSHGSVWAHGFAKWLVQLLNPGFWGSREKQEVHQRQTYIMGASDGRRMIHTRKGYLGLVPAETRQGDRIGLFVGGKVPLIIRPRDGGTWELIGESYLHGMMFGEVFDRAACKEVLIS